jgi:hypothetical protein
MQAVLKSVHASGVFERATSESQDEDSMLMCLSNSPDVDSMSMRQSNSHCDAVMMGPPC